MKCSPYSGQLSAKRSSNIKHKLFLEFAVFHALLQWLQFLLKERNLCIVMSNQVGVAVINLASHHCDPGSILGWYAGCDWLISIWLEGLSPGCPVFLPPQKSCFRRLPQNPCLVAGLYLKKFTRFDGYLYFIFSCHEFNFTDKIHMHLSHARITTAQHWQISMNLLHVFFSWTVPQSLTKIYNIKTFMGSWQTERNFDQYRNFIP